MRLASDPWAFWAAGVAVVICTGCGGPPMLPVTGKVIYSDGSPLTAGMIQFRCTQTSPPNVARGRIGADGTFELSTDGRKGAIAGEFQVILVPEIPRDTDGLQGRARSMAMTGGVDPRFTSYDTSNLQFTVQAGQENHITVEVSPPP